MSVNVLKIALLLFGSGACSLIYQVGWLRELRLVFGASTAASAAVLAIFMGGLGLGSIFLGRWADSRINPLLFYSRLEMAIAGSVLLTPFMMMGVRQAYIWLGGSAAMGPVPATAVRLILSAMILGLPTFLMGGTLPAAARAATNMADMGRRRVALLYGFNTLGAVLGVALATFFMLEIFGTRNSLWIACLCNGIIALIARGIARSAVITRTPVAIQEPPPPSAAVKPAGFIPPGFVFWSAGLLGFVFMQMELIWYRMLSPLLGGSTYTFGLILAVALLGIGIGGVAYALRSQSSRATLRVFALTCGLEAFFLAVPFALGDRIAVLAALLHPLGQIGMGGQVIGWSLITGLVVLPAAVVSGYQFPLLIGILGRGKEKVGQHIGLAYAWNTGGAITGSLAGGFFVLPLLTAPAGWKLMATLLILLCVTAVWISLRRKEDKFFSVLTAAIIVWTILMLQSTGPTSVWRHTPIGAGRVDLTGKSHNEIKAWRNRARWEIVWEAEGLEASLGLSAKDGLAFIMNGKSDGNARMDAPTQVMLGMVGAALHPKPQTAMVIGLGTGSSAGWLADIGSIRRVDVAELEPGILEVARRCAPVNRNVLSNPKVRTIIADAREVLLTSSDQYDLIVSEPSNPYRAGIASLYSYEFYQAVARSLAPGGIFSQWVQAYEVDSHTVRTIYATLLSVFPVVETWQTMSRDLLLVCSMTPRRYSAPQLRRRLALEPFRTALLVSWGVTDLEGFLSRFVAPPLLARKIAARELQNDWLNTDDRMLVEFGFARTVGQVKSFTIADLEKASRKRGEERLQVADGEVNWEMTDENRIMMYVAEERKAPELEWLTAQQRLRAKAYNHFLNGQLKAAYELWEQQSRSPEYPFEIAMVAETMADIGKTETLELTEKLRPLWPGVADAILARYYWRVKQPEQAFQILESAIKRLRDDPWPNLTILRRTLYMARDMVAEYEGQTRKIFDSLSIPFSVQIFNYERLRILLDLAERLGDEAVSTVMTHFEPNVPWEDKLLYMRATVYNKTENPLARQAAKDLEDFRRYEPIRISDSIR